MNDLIEQLNEIGYVHWQFIHGRRYDTQRFKHVPFLVSTNQWIAINIVNATRLLGFILSNVCHTLSTGIKPLRDYHIDSTLLLLNRPKVRTAPITKIGFVQFHKSKESDEQTRLFLPLFKRLDVFRFKGAHCVRLCTTINCARYADHGKNINPSLSYSVNRN